MLLLPGFSVGLGAVRIREGPCFSDPLALPSVSFTRVALLRRPSRGFGVLSLPRVSWAPLGCG